MKITLIGYGKETKSAYAYYSVRYPKSDWTVYDASEAPPEGLPEGARYMHDSGQVLEIEADIIIRTPSVHPHRVHTSGFITSVTNEFFEKCQLPIIGVTGTKGKGTTASLIKAILRRAGIKTWLVGNIGQPSLDVLDETAACLEAGEKGVVIYELSSFQAWDMRRSPRVAVVLMVEPEHLDVHDNFDEYIDAKANITRWQGGDDAVVYFADNTTSAKIARYSKGRKIPYQVEPGEYLIVREKEIMQKRDITLPGEHNLENISAAVAAAMEFVSDTSVIQQSIMSFHGLPHRLEIVAEKNGITYVNDSFSSAPPATIAAIQAFPQPKIMIIGGKDRGLPYAQLAKQLSVDPHVKKVIIIGEARQRIAAALDNADFINYEIRDDVVLDDIVLSANKIATAGDVVILSPGCASFDMFENFTERGEQFKAIVEQL